MELQKSTQYNFSSAAWMRQDNGALCGMDAAVGGFFFLPRLFLFL
jgi:hypothetical protein